MSRMQPAWHPHALRADPALPCLTSSWDQATLTSLPLRPRLRSQQQSWSQSWPVVTMIAILNFSTFVPKIYRICNLRSLHTFLIQAAQRRASPDTAGP